MVSQIGIEARDIAYNPDTGFRVSGGDFELTDSSVFNGENGFERFNEADEKHVEWILKSTVGSFRQFPTLGVNLFSYLNSVDTLSTRTKIKAKIKTNLELGGNLQADEISVLEGLNISATVQRIKA